MSSTGKNLFAKGTGSGTKYVVVEVGTNHLTEEEVYVHEIPFSEAPNWWSILDAINTLYGHEGVNSVCMNIKQE